MGQMNHEYKVFSENYLNPRDEEERNATKFAFFAGAATVFMLSEKMSELGKIVGKDIVFQVMDEFINETRKVVRDYMPPEKIKEMEDAIKDKGL